MKLILKTVIFLFIATSLMRVCGLGAATPDGETFILTLGMSNANSEFRDWKKNNETDYFILNAAQAGQDLYRLMPEPGVDPQPPYIGQGTMPTYLDWVKNNRLERNGFDESMVDIVVFKNTTANHNRYDWPIFTNDLQRQQDTIAGYNYAIEAFEQRYPNMTAGYLVHRSWGEWCEKAGQVTVTISQYAIPYVTVNRPNWHEGPKLYNASVPWIREDFVQDGCHPVTHSNGTPRELVGVVKTTEILNEFFLAVQNGEEPEDPEDPEVCTP